MMQGWNSCISLKEKDKSSNLETPTNTQSTANIIGMSDS